MHFTVADHLAQFGDFLHAGMDEFLAAKAGVHGHHADQVHEVEQGSGRLGRGAGVEGEACLGTRGADGLKRAVDVRTGLHMGCDHIGTGIGEGLDVGIDGCDHQVNVHHRLDVRADRGAGGGAEGDVGHEMAVHDIDVNPVRALCLDRLNLGAEIGEVGREDGRGDFYRTVKFHGGSS
jgi:hypothetical protein